MNSTSDPVERLYSVFNAIKESLVGGQHSMVSAQFDQILAAATSTSDMGATPNSKRLAAQFICRLFAELPSAQQKAAYNALVDLVEEDDPQTRRQVISGLPKLCCGKAAGSGHVAQVADVLVQLMQTDDLQELSLVQHSLLQVLNSNAHEAIAGIFGQIGHDDVPDLARLRAVKFLADRLLCVNRAQLTPRVEEAIVSHVEAALQDVSEEEFGHFVRVLASLQCMQTVEGRQRLVDIICSQADIEAEFDPLDPACLAKVSGCAKHALPFMSKNIVADKFIIYFLDKVLPSIDRVPEESVDSHDRPRLDLLRHFADLCGHAGPNFKPSESHLACLLNCLISRTPPPPSDDPAAAATAAPPLSDTNLNFSEAECLLLGLHRVASCSPGYFTDRAVELAQLRLRLQCFQYANQSYQKSLKSTIEAQPSAAAASTDSTTRAARIAALAITASVGQLITGFLANPPAFLTAAPSSSTAAPVASWHTGRRAAVQPLLQPPPLAEEALQGSSHAMPASTSSRKRRAVDLPTYRPPAGKFSSSLRGGGPRSAAGFGGRSRYYNVYTAAGGSSGRDGSSAAGK